MHIRKHTLANGLRMVHSQDKSTRMVALNVVYHVGARDESPDCTGLAHLVEHLMFGGSVHIPDFDELLEQAGGDSNAWTNSDVTNYYLTIPGQNVETAFCLESDRMLGLNFSEENLNIQKDAVMEEFVQHYLNKPYGDVAHLLYPLAYQVHPYQWPTIGKCLRQIDGVTLEEIKDFFLRFYSPANAVLSVTGDITFEEAVRLAEKWFAPIPCRELFLRNIPGEPPQETERRLSVERAIPLAALFMAFRMCDRFHPDYPVFNALSALLGSGPSSRLQQRLVYDRQVFSSINARISGTMDDGLFQVAGKLAPGISLEQAEEAVWEELRQLQSVPVSANELDKVKDKFESAHVSDNVSYVNLAANLAWHELTGQAEDLEREVEKYRVVTSQQLYEVAQRTFRPENSSVLYYQHGNIF